MELVHARGDKFTVSRIQVEEGGSVIVSVTTDVGDEGISTDEGVTVAARVQGAENMTLAQIELKGLNRAAAILQAAAVQLSDQIHVDPGGR